MSDIQFTTKHADIKPSGFYVYMHRRATDGSVFYVGKGSGKRAWVSRRTYNPHWTNVALRHGVVVDIVKSCLNEVCAITIEKILIASIGLDNLTNLVHGGYGGMSGYKWTDKQIKNKSGVNHFNYGRVTPDGVKAKLSTALSGKKHVFYGRKLPEGQRLMIVAWHKENRHPMLGVNHSEESKEKISAAHKGKPKPIHTTEMKSKPLITECGMTFPNSISAVDWLKNNGSPKANGGAISKCARGVKYYNTAYGYKWSFI